MKSSNAHFEDLQIRIFVDNSIVEVYANDRFALTARIYPTLDTALGVSCDFRSSKGGESLDRGKVAGFACWDRLVKAWPGRHVEEEDVEAVNGKTDLTEVHISEPHVHVIAA
jgi:beta-fructofuranosidase